jgi:hypothetical protein
MELGALSPSLLKSRSEAFALICEVFSPHPISALTSNALREPECATAILHLAEDEKVLPYLHDALVKHSFKDLPKAARAIAATAYETNRHRNISLRGAIIELGAAGLEVGIQFVPLKGGAWIAEDAVSFASWRQMIDLDVLVHPDQFDSSRRLLEKLGYKAASDTKRFEDNFHHAPYRHPTIPVVVEIHRHLGWRHLLLPPRLIFEGALPMAPGLQIATPWIRAYHAILHWQIQDHGISRQSLPLKELVEIARFINRSDVDWPSLLSHAGKVDTLSACERAIASVNTLMNITTAEEIGLKQNSQRWVMQSITRRRSPLATWFAREKWRVGVLWRCEKTEYRCSVLGMNPSKIALRVWTARIIRLPILFFRAAGIPVRALICVIRGNLLSREYSRERTTYYSISGISDFADKR